MGHSFDQDWVSEEIADEIEHAAQESHGTGFTNPDELIADLRG